MLKPYGNGFPKEYYAEKPEHMIVHLGDVREPLSDRSIAVLYRFVRWPMDVEDSFKNEKPFTEEEIEQMKSLGPRGLGELMDELGQIRKGKGHTKT